MSTNNVLPEKTKDDLLSVKERSKDILTKLMKERFCEDNPSNCYVTIKKNKKSRTFGTIINNLLKLQMDPGRLKFLRRTGLLVASTSG